MKDLEKVTVRHCVTEEIRDAYSDGERLYDENGVELDPNYAEHELGNGMTIFLVTSLIVLIILGIWVREMKYETTEQGFMQRCIQDGGNEVECKSAWVAEQDKKH